jgi:hypothetical protein
MIKILQKYIFVVFVNVEFKHSFSSLEYSTYQELHL